MFKVKQKIYYINRYQGYKLKDIKSYSGYEQIIKYEEVFQTIKVSPKLGRNLIKLLNIKVPENYIKSIFGDELMALIVGVITGRPIFYLYADKDAFLIPKVKKKFGLKRLKLYGTLHWPKEISREFSFYKYNLASQFDGIITLSSTLQQNFKKSVIIPHGIDLEYWKSNTNQDYCNFYLLLGQSNRDHLKQVEVIKEIKNIDSKARFVLLAQQKSIYGYYEGVEDLKIIKEKITDSELKRLYATTRAVILIQKHCLASNVVLESLAMSVPVVANNVGDISEYLGINYPLYCNENNDNLIEFCTNENFRNRIKKYLELKRHQFAWRSIVQKTISYINNEDFK